jgi:hypothetical protein
MPNLRPACELRQFSRHPYEIADGLFAWLAHLTSVEIMISQKNRRKLNRSFPELRSPEVFLDRPAIAAKMLLPTLPFFNVGRSGFIQTVCFPGYFPGYFVERISLLSKFFEAPGLQ